MQSWGYVKLSRKAYASDPFWLEPRRYSRWEAWEDMIQMAAFRKHTRTVGLELVTLNRGELLASRRYLARRWKWGEKAIRGWLEMLVRTERIRAQRETQVGTVYLLVNYTTYQMKGPSKGPPKGQPRAQQGPTEGPKEKAVKAVKKEEKLSSVFEQAWTAYPKRQGGNPKARAVSAWFARVAQGVLEADMLAGVERYARYCDAVGKTGTEYVMHAGTFFGPGERWKESYAVTAQKHSEDADILALVRDQEKRYA